MVIYLFGMSYNKRGIYKMNELSNKRYNATVRTVKMDK